jgi:Spy/CpxP family protein refolding chaperone
MRIESLAAFAILLSSLWVQAQTPTSPARPQKSRPESRGDVIYRREMGKWWQNSDVARKLQLSDGQITQLEQTFYDHRVKLIDYGAEMEKQDLKLQSLLDADVPNEGQVEGQVDQVLAARGKLEREFTMMNLDLRKVLSLEQWRQLKSIRGESGGFGDRIFFRKVLPPGAEPLPPGAEPFTAPLPPGMPPGMLTPPPPPDELF